MVKTGNVYIGPLAELPNPETTDLRPGIIFISDDTISNRVYTLKMLADGSTKWVSMADNSDYSF